MSKPLVFVVDDEQENIDVVCRTLRSYRTRGFTDPREVRAAAIELEPNAIVIDYRMPHMDGVQLIRQLRDSGIGCGVLMVTAYPEADEVVFAAQSELIYRIIAKPFKPDFLRHLARMVLEEAAFDRRLAKGNAFSRLDRTEKGGSAPGAPRPSRLAPDGRVHFSIDDEKLSSKLLDISLGGLAVETRESTPLRRLVHIDSVELAGKSFPLDSPARVVWCHDQDDSELFSVGVRFEPNSVSWETISAIMRQAYVSLVAALPEDG